MRARLGEQLGEALVLILCWLALTILGWAHEHVMVVERAAVPTAAA